MAKSQISTGAVTIDKATAKMNKIKDPASDKVFYGIVYGVLGIILIVVLYPCYFILLASVSDPNIVNSGAMLWYPQGFNTLGYERVFADMQIWTGYLNTIIYTVFGTLFGLSVVILGGYSLSRRDLPFRGIIMKLFVFTMYFGGGLIPMYMLVSDLGLIDTRWVLILLGSFSVYNMIIARSFFQNSIPAELQEASFIDGAGNGRFFVSIVLPLSKPIIAVIALYIAVGKWNEYFNALIYIRDMGLQTLQFILRIKLMSVQTTDLNTDPVEQELMLKMAEVIKYAIIVVATVPILTIYPFIQKYFAKGVMIGAIKG